jgi:hypothetical protein
LVRLSEADRPSGVQAEVLRAVQNLVVLMDEHFLVHTAIHKAVLRLLRNCAGDDLQEQLDGRKVMGAASTVASRPISEYEEDRECIISEFLGTILSHNSCQPPLHPLQSHKNLSRIVNDLLPR